MCGAEKRALLRKAQEPWSSDTRPVARKARALPCEDASLLTRRFGTALLCIPGFWLTFEFTRVRKRAKPAVALRVQRRVRRRRAHGMHGLAEELEVVSAGKVRQRIDGKARSNA